MRTYHFWIDNGEEKDDSDLAKPELVLTDDSDLPLAAIIGWAGDEMDIESSSVTLIVRCLPDVPGAKDLWLEVDMYRQGWAMSSSRETSPEELRGEH